MRNQSISRTETVLSEWDILKLLKWTTGYFKSHDIDSPRATAEILLAHVLKSERIDLYLNHDKPLRDDELAAFKSLIIRRIKREPVAYIVGGKGFWSMELAVNENVLIPRPETELLVESALALLPPDGTPKRVLELGTGSGAIVAALALERANHIFFASDRSIKALAVARENVKKCCPRKSIRFFAGDWFQALRGGEHPFDMILSNPPYIQTREIERLQPEIHRYEPALALDGDSDGLASIRHIIHLAPGFLSARGVLLLEIGHDQKEDVKSIMDDRRAYGRVDFHKDYSGYDRVVSMWKMHAAAE